MEGSTALSLEPFPRVSRLGMAGFIIQFADEFRTDANKAALAFRSYVEQDRPDFVTETSTSLVSVFIAVNPFVHDDREVELWLSNVLDTQNWYHAPLPKGRRLFEIPCVFGTDLAPQLHDAAQTVGLHVDDAIHELTSVRSMVFTIGYAPGQPYTGLLDQHWDLPRLSQLNPMVPAGALVTAIRQLIIFSGPTPTGWWHIGQTAFRCFQPKRDPVFALQPGDEIQYRAVGKRDLEHYENNDERGFGGALVDIIS